ncbi:MAG: DUF2007 domain-containing protein [Sediminibacterium sp.]|jgi:hypothetical protein|nr:DUF2007 domain-containing protein [Sediminibacterium sp.]
MSNWKKVFSSSQLAVASMVSGILMEQKIQTNVLNKIDSSYVFLGEVEVYVSAADYENALLIVKDFQI